MDNVIWDKTQIKVASQIMARIGFADPTIPWSDNSTISHRGFRKAIYEIAEAMECGGWPEHRPLIKLRLRVAEKNTDNEDLDSTLHVAENFASYLCDLRRYVDRFPKV